jgi:hypothetical protein
MEYICSFDQQHCLSDTTMKKLQLFVIACILTGNMLLAQSVGIGTTTPDTSALLHLHSASKGVLLPRITTAQRNGIAAPAAGLLIYNTSASAFQFYNGTSWADIGSGSAGGTAGYDTMALKSDRISGLYDDDGMYVFYRNGAGAAAWSYQAFTWNGTIYTISAFGNQLAATDDEGVYIFYKNSSGAGTWLYKAIPYTGSTPKSLAFGNQLARYNDDTACVFYRNAAGVYTTSQQVLPYNGSAYKAIAFGDQAAFYDDDGVYVFYKNGAGAGVWSYQALPWNGTIYKAAAFGNQLMMYDDDGAYVFSKNGSGTGVWSYQALTWNGTIYKVITTGN